MPQAYTIEQKKEMALAKQAAEKNMDSTPVVQPLDGGSQRKRRNVFNGTEAKLSIRHTIPGYHLHVFTDSGNRVQEAQDAGYEFVSPDEIGGVSDNVVSRNGDLGDRVRFLVNPRADGPEQFGYLMKTRQEWFDEDQAALQAKNTAIDNAIKKGKITGENPAFYVPKDGIKMS